MNRINDLYIFFIKINVFFSVHPTITTNINNMIRSSFLFIFHVEDDDDDDDSFKQFKKIE